jgi:iron(III) transport system substrate-binding protein
MRSLLLALISVYFVASFVSAQTKSLNDLANYRGADREEVLKAGAKKEGKMVWYTSLTAHRDIANVFEAKYPGIKVETYRAGPNDLTRRLITEAQSKRSIADLIETTPATLMMMRENKLLAPYFSPHLAQFPEDAKEEADKGRVF